MPTSFRWTPHDCPCQQCFNLIPAADWADQDTDRIRYLWRCEKCEYEFETIAVYVKDPAQQVIKPQQSDIEFALAS
jgi:hypothetical protein